MSAETAEKLVALCREKNATIVTAESCTAGLVAARLTDIPGSSAVFDRGFITYSNASKTEMLDVDPELLEIHGAVSEEVARAMAHGALLQSHAELAVSVTGIAGPSGGSPEKPVGLVFIAAGSRFGKVICEEHFFPGSRSNIRETTVLHALQMLCGIAEKM